MQRLFPFCPSSLLTLLAVPLFLSCGGNNTGTSNAGAGALCKSTNPPAECGVACNATSNPCNIGFYCGSDSKCTADCDVKTNTGCSGGNVCAVNGVCVDPTASNDGGNNTCANVKLTGARKTPNVVLLLDQSGSMQSTDFKDANNVDISRWDLLKNIMIGTTAERSGAGGGFVKAYEDKVRFSLEMYSGIKNPKQCPVLTPTLTGTLTPSLNAYTAIRDVLSPAPWIDDTPTAEAIDAVVGKLNKVDSAGDPTIILLATDGDPDSCADPDANGQQGPRTASEMAVTNALVNKGILTYVIGISTEPTGAHLQNLANNGVPGGAGTYYRGTNLTNLQEAFDTIIGGQISCSVFLNGKVDAAQACDGVVTINNEGTPLKCTDPDGWKLTDPTHIEIQGQACDRLKAAGTNAAISAVFPCGAVTVAF